MPIHARGRSAGGSSGESGWGFYALHQQEMTADGRAIGILRYGKSFDNSALYDQQASAHFLLYDPPGPAQLQNDLLGVGYTWAQATESTARSESNVEVFYRFPIVPLADVTLSDEDPGRGLVAALAIWGSAFTCTPDAMAAEKVQAFAIRLNDMFGAQGA